MFYGMSGMVPVWSHEKVSHNAISISQGKWKDNHLNALFMCNMYVSKCLIYTSELGQGLAR